MRPLCLCSVRVAAVCKQVRAWANLQGSKQQPRRSSVQNKCFMVSFRPRFPRCLHATPIRRPPPWLLPPGSDGAFSSRPHHSSDGLCVVGAQAVRRVLHRLIAPAHHARGGLAVEPQAQGLARRQAQLAGLRGAVRLMRHGGLFSREPLAWCGARRCPIGVQHINAQPRSAYASATPPGAHLEGAQGPEAAHKREHAAGEQRRQQLCQDVDLPVLAEGCGVEGLGFGVAAAKLLLAGGEPRCRAGTGGWALRNAAAC